MSDLYRHDDYDCEIKYQTEIYQKYPNMVVQIYDHWIHETDDVPQLLPHILAQPPGSAQGDNIYKSGFIITELMTELDMYSYFKQISLPSCTNTAAGTNTYERPYINIIGALFILLNLVYILHYEFNITHGDLRDRNIFLRYHYPEWKQLCTGGYLKNNTLLIDTSGWEIKIGDFGLADNIRIGEGSFIIRDYEFLDNIYCSRNKWRHTCGGTEFNNIITFIKNEFLQDIYNRINKYRKDGQSIIDARHTFWFNKHRILQHSIFIHELPQRLIIKISELLPNSSHIPYTIL
jgi:serine/threonine protein kinase